MYYSMSGYVRICPKGFPPFREGLLIKSRGLYLRVWEPAILKDGLTAPPIKDRVGNSSYQFHR